MLSDEVERSHQLWLLRAMTRPEIADAYYLPHRKSPFGLWALRFRPWDTTPTPTRQRASTPVQACSLLSLGALCEIS